MILGDKSYTSMMLVKALCAHLASRSGYNFLFQDVDIVWYKHPLENYFSQEWMQDYDIIFQDDGQHTTRFGPYHVNSGFYFVRNNALTRHFVSAVFFSGQMIAASRSHQQAVAAVLSEHVSLYGLKGKVISRDTWELPTGWHFQRPSNWKNFKEVLISGNNSRAVLFHMSWTNHKKEKIEYIQQLGQWYVNQTCFDAKQDPNKYEHHLTFRYRRPEGTSMVTDWSTVPYGACCLPKADFVCHYRDKPSLYPCRDSPKKDNGAEFW